MRVMVYFSLQPIDPDRSLSDEIAQAVQILRDHGLKTEIGPTGTTIFGQLGTIFQAIEQVHEELARDGQRVNSELVVDAKPGMDLDDMRGRVERVKQRLEEPPDVSGTSASSSSSEPVTA
jgi:uncharacterized protein YqgV (UPF0045/DUF77 family)